MLSPDHLRAFVSLLDVPPLSLSFEDDLANFPDGSAPPSFSRHIMRGSLGLRNGVDHGHRKSGPSQDGHIDDIIAGVSRL
jgi:hypothetical protein